MAGTSGRRSRAASIQKQAIDQMNASLQELPEKPKDNLSLREAVNLLQDEIRAALSKGYTHEDLAAIFADQGIEISALTLKRYVSSGKSQSTKAKATTGRTRTRRTRKSEAESSAAADQPPPAISTSDDEVESEEPTPTRGRRRRTSAAKAQSGNSTKTEESAPKRTTSRGSGTSTQATNSSTPRTRRKGTKSGG